MVTQQYQVRLYTMSNRPIRQSQLIDQEPLGGGGPGAWSTHELAAMDNAFGEAMRKAVAKGLEKPTGVSTAPGTKRPLVNYQRD